MNYVIDKFVVGRKGIRPNLCVNRRNQLFRTLRGDLAVSKDLHLIKKGLTNWRKMREIFILDFAVPETRAGHYGQFQNKAANRKHL